MIQFQCIHCGGRIAVNKRHTGRLARCPECGGVTHPLAEHLVAPAESKQPGRKKRKRTSPDAVAGKSKKPMADALADSVACDNCGKALGKLQKPLKWKDHSVCGPCYRALAVEHGTLVDEPERLPVAASSAIVVRPDSPRSADPAPTIIFDSPRG